MSLSKNFARRALIFAFAGLAGTAYALPSLQLTIAGGTYVGGSDETTYAAGNAFTLYAFLSPKNNCNQACLDALLNDTYYISAALAPKTGPVDDTLGSFVFAGNTISATTDMEYGTPPLETVVTQLGDPGDLSSHGIFETFFYETGFKFSSTVSTTPFDVQNNPPTSVSDNDEGMYFASFAIDISALTSLNHSIHFDLYNSKVQECKNDKCVLGDIDVNDFAPFSHDAQSLKRSGDQPDPPVLPEPGVLTLLGIGLLGLTLMRRRNV